MKKDTLGKVVFLIIIVIAITTIVYPKFDASNKKDMQNTKLSVAEQRVKNSAGSQNQTQSENQLSTQSQNQNTGKGEAQLAEAVKSGRPSMILFHSDG